MLWQSQGHGGAGRQPDRDKVLAGNPVGGRDATDPDVPVHADEIRHQGRGEGVNPYPLTGHVL